jgi:hypothetical protein
MKNLFFIISLLSSVYSFGQCNEYYINELISGPTERFFGSGSPIRFCPKEKGVVLNGYIYDTYQWEGISTQYITLTKDGGIAGNLVLSLKEKTLLVSVFGSPGDQLYSLSFDKLEYESFLKENKNREETRDKKLKAIIEENLQKNEYFKAYNLYNQIKIKDNSLESRVMQKWVPFSDSINNEYETYKLEFERISEIKKLEYSNDRISFLNKESNNIEKQNKTFDGIDVTVINQDLYIEFRDKFCYFNKEKDKYVFYPLGINSNYNSSKFVETYNNLTLKYINSEKFEKELPVIIADYTFDNTTQFDTFYIVNKFEIDFYVIPFNYSSELNDFYEIISLQEGKTFFQSNYPILKITLDNIFNLRDRVVREARENEKIDIPKENFKYFPVKPYFATINVNDKEKDELLLSLKLISKIKEMYDYHQCDSIIIVSGNSQSQEYSFCKNINNISKISKTIYLRPESSNNDNQNQVYIFPLKKGLVELIKKPKYPDDKIAQQKYNSFKKYLKLYNSSAQTEEILINENSGLGPDIILKTFSKKDLEKMATWNEKDIKWQLNKSHMLYKKLTLLPNGDKTDTYGNFTNPNPDIFISKDNLSIVVFKLYNSRDTRCPNYSYIETK